MVTEKCLRPLKLVLTLKRTSRLFRVVEHETEEGTQGKAVDPRPRSQHVQESCIKVRGVLRSPGEEGVRKEKQCSKDWRRVCMEELAVKPKEAKVQALRMNMCPNHVKHSENYSSKENNYIKEPVEIHNIKQRDGESTEEFVRRYKLECRDAEGAPKCMKIFGFMQRITNPELIKRLYEKIPNSVDEMMRVTTAFLRGEVAASNRERKKLT
ncbi:hypothetical protein Tco_1406893 [Tanacetum coccineum]